MFNHDSLSFFTPRITLFFYLMTADSPTFIFSVHLKFSLLTFIRSHRPTYTPIPLTYYHSTYLILYSFLNPNYNTGHPLHVELSKFSIENPVNPLTGLRRHPHLFLHYESIFIKEYIIA